MTKQEIHKLIQEELTNHKLEEGVMDWMSGVARNMAYSIIDKRGAYLTQAIKSDPKLQKLAKDLKINTSDFEKRVASLLDKDPKFLKALATQKAKRI
jgi:hypothetical protein